MFFYEEVISNLWNLPLFLCSALLAFDSGMIFGEWTVWSKTEYLLSDAWVVSLLCLILSVSFAGCFLFDAVSEVKVMTVICLVVLASTGFLISLVAAKIESKKQES